MTQDKLAERTTLVLHLGYLLAPFRDLANAQAPPTLSAYRVAAARYVEDQPRWRARAAEFANVAGVVFQHELYEIEAPVRALRTGFTDFCRRNPDDASRQTHLREWVERIERDTLAAIDSVPIDLGARLFEERSPFSVCMSISDAMLRAKRCVHYFDRYLRPDFFPLYLRPLSRSLSIRLITTAGRPNDYGVVMVEPLARLAAQEFADLQLLQCEVAHLHDRNLRVDDQVFYLGPSIDDAGRHPTNFGPSDSTAAGHAVIDSIMSRGRRIC